MLDQAQFLQLSFKLTVVCEALAELEPDVELMLEALRRDDTLGPLLDTTAWIDRSRATPAMAERCRAALALIRAHRAAQAAFGGVR